MTAWSVIPISTHAPRVRRDKAWIRNLYNGDISTHAPRVRRDIADTTMADYAQISTHAPRVRRDTSALVCLDMMEFDFYSRASCEARLLGLDQRMV